MDEDTVSPEYLDALKKLTGMGSGHPLSMRRNLEQRYALAYQKMVKLGQAPQIRGKYRP